MNEKTHRGASLADEEPSRRGDAEALERLLDELIRDVDTPAPTTGELDQETVAWARRIVAVRQSQRPKPAEESAALARIWARVLASARTASTPNRPPVQRHLPRWFSRTWPRVGLAAAGIVIAIAIGLYAWASQPSTVSAQEIIQKAQAAANSPLSNGVQSYIISGTNTSRPEKGVVAGLTGNELLVNESKFWYQSPNRWRGESTGKVLDEQGREIPNRAWHIVSLSDGVNLWNYDAIKNAVVISSAPSVPSGSDIFTPYGALPDMARWNQLVSTCYDPKVTGSATIAGRPTYVIDLGPTKCPSASAPEMNGRLVIWVDKETFFILKEEQYSPEGDKVVYGSQVTEVQYNVPIDPAEFTFTPPAGAKVTDNRPKPAPSSDQFKQQLQDVARQVDFPVLAPAYVPAKLAPKQPKIDEIMGRLVEISYFPSDAIDKDSGAGMMNGITIREQRATNSLVARWTDRADPLTIAGNKGWLRRGTMSPGGTGSDSAALVLRDGVLVSISSFTIAPEELVKVAASLQTVPGSHAPLPNPVPPTLAELRSKVAFPIFVPTFVPAGLTPEQPTGGELPGENVAIEYHDASGAVALTILNGTLDCCPGLEMMKSESIKLPNGLSAKLSNMGPNAGGLYLWFEREERLISLNSPLLTKDQMLQVATSMSKTADLGKVQAPPARPTPTPPAPLKYAVLRPTWLPEPMTVGEQRDGETTTLRFDPHPKDAPHEVLTLTEMPKGLVGGGGAGASIDPQAKRERIGQYDVTVIYRGNNCTMFDWEVGNLHLTLANAYDPPGRLRYTCDQLVRVVESIGSP